MYIIRKIKHQIVCLWVSVCVCVCQCARVSVCWTFVAQWPWWCYSWRRFILYILFIRIHYTHAKAHNVLCINIYGTITYTHSTHFSPVSKTKWWFFILFVIKVTLFWHTYGNRVYTQHTHTQSHIYRQSHTVTQSFSHRQGTFMALMVIMKRSIHTNLYNSICKMFYVIFSLLCSAIASFSFVCLCECVGVGVCEFDACSCLCILYYVYKLCANKIKTGIFMVVGRRERTKYKPIYLFCAKKGIIWTVM